MIVFEKWERLVCLLVTSLSRLHTPRTIDHALGCPRCARTRWMSVG